MKREGIKQGFLAVGLGAAVLFFSSSPALAVPTVTDTAELLIVDGDGYNDSHYDLKFDFTSDANWGSFDSLLTSNLVTSAMLHIDFIPQNNGFDTDRMRVMISPDNALDKSEDRLTPIAGTGIGVPSSNGPNDRVLKLDDLGVQLGASYAGGVYTLYELAYIDVELLDWFSASDLSTLLRDNDGILHMVNGDDVYVTNAYLTFTLPEPVETQETLPTPEPASFFLFGSGLVGLAAWRFKKNQRKE